MARSMWSGSISFGLVNVPVKLYSAVSQKEVHFNMLHEKDGGRIKQKRVCSKDGEEVPWDEIAKGYQISPQKFVMVTKEELEAFDPKATRTIEIMDFVELEEIDPIFYETTYYLAPDRGAGKPYSLLMKAMKKTKKVAIAKVVLRTRQYVCALRPMGDALTMSTMLYADEIVPAKDIAPLQEIDANPTERELTMAVQLVEALAAKFDPSKYHDEHREKVLELLKRKAEGEEIIGAEPEEETGGKVVNLIDALQASLEARKAGDSGSDRHHAERPKAAARSARTRKKP